MSSPLGYQYPAGAENDPRAPYNQKDDEACEKCKGEGLRDCPDCDGEGCEECACNCVIACDACDGSGIEPKPTAEDIACDKADRAMDEAKDEPRD